ncbi:MAG: metallophosphoesterase [Candidatus Thorarchaeota archaeon]|nr:metallophosphoesterase [Candidatus Thorarchaeota archaeon]
MKLLAVADVHSPRYLEEFVKDLGQHERPDAFLFAGDMINRGNAEEYKNVLDTIEKILGTSFPVIGCFGNEEYSEVRKDIVSIVGDRMILLDEKSYVLESNGLTVGIVGTQGSLDKATSWQRRNIPSVKGVFERRAKRAASLLKKMKDKVDHRILLMHYSPCLETCEGEETKAFSWMGSRKFYSVVVEHQPDLVIHGHVHNSTRHEVTIGASFIRNVSFPAVGSITELNVWDTKKTRRIEYESC